MLWVVKVRGYDDVWYRYGVIMQWVVTVRGYDAVGCTAEVL